MVCASQRPQFPRYHPSREVHPTTPSSYRPHTNLTPSDLNAQTRDFKYSSWCKVESFEDALLVMVLKGEKQLLTQIKVASPSMSSVTTDINQLSLSSSFMEDKGRCSPEVYSSNYDSRNHLLGEQTASPSLSACGRTSIRPPGTLSHVQTDCG